MTRRAPQAPRAPAGTLDVLELGPTGAGRHASLAVVRDDDGIRPELLVTDDHEDSRPARAGDGAVAALVGRWSAPTETGTFAGRWEADVPRGGPEVQVSTDHANLSVATGEVLVKLLRRPTPGTRPSELARHLGSVGFDAIATPLGELRWTDTDGVLGDAGGEVVIAVANRYLRDAQDGWARFRDVATSALQGGEADAAWEQTLAELGRLVAGFHVAMATPSAILPTPGSVATADDRRRWYQRGVRQLDDALAEVDAAVGHHLRCHETDLRERLARLVADADPTPTLRVHGDLHVGQVLTAAGRMHLTDLDGGVGPDPGASPAPEPAARDVASVVRSLDHVGRLAAERVEDVDGAAVERWIGRARAICLRAYTETLIEHGRRELYDDRMLAPFEAAQICHELLYATRNLHAWLPVARAALQARSDRDVTDAT